MNERSKLGTKSIADKECRQREFGLDIGNLVEFSKSLMFANIDGSAFPSFI
jgi:hypothetical protein